MHYLVEIGSLYQCSTRGTRQLHRPRDGSYKIQGVTETAADLMLRNPKTLRGDASVAEVREQLANPKVQMGLLADGPAFRGAVTAVPDEAASREPALGYADDKPETIPPDAPADEAFQRAAASPNRRVIVLDAREPLFLHCADDLSVAEKARRSGSLTRVNKTRPGLASMPAITRSIWLRVRIMLQTCSIACAPSNCTRQARATECTVSPVESETRWR